MNMTWQDFKKYDCSVITDNIDYVITFLQHDRIDINKFLSNFQFLYGHNLFGKPPYYLTPSIRHFEFSPTRPTVPDWFISGYPDVLSWYIKQSNEDIKANIDFDYKPGEPYNIMKDGLAIQSKTLRRIVKWYQNSTANKLECSI
jgi:hypothetical protein